MARLENGLEHAGMIVPAAIALLYGLVMAWITLRHHHIGGMGVETDFYVELVPQARKLLAGEFSPHNYGAKGPVYSVVLAVFTVIARDFFRAGLIVNLLSASVYLFIVNRLFAAVFNTTTALLASIAIACNYVFMSHTYQAGSDAVHGAERRGHVFRFPGGRTP